MAEIVDSVKQLSVENDAKPCKNDQKIRTHSKLHLWKREKASDESGDYTISVCGTQSDQDFYIATSSGRFCTIFQLGQSLGNKLVLPHHQASIVGIKFNSTSNNILYTATNDGGIKIFDLRDIGDNKAQLIMELDDNYNTEDGKARSLVSFDVSSDDKFLAAGTEQTDGDAFIIFWDIRYNKKKMSKKQKSHPIGGYWESHTDDITCLAFHSVKPNVLASGSTDGLVNVFDLAQPSEDTALTYTLNTESSVDRLGWLNDDSLWCTTHTHALQLWNCEGASAYATFERSRLAVLPNDDPENCYLVKYHNTNAFGQPFLLAGYTTNNSENLRCLDITSDRLEICDEIINNNQIVRDSWVHEKSATLATVGENGIIDLWRPEHLDEHCKAQSGKINTAKNRQHRTKPY
ncbi:WD repeat-containing protein 89 [Odontomachus brunneus]|uniref:WD repeat-containing protein 89 n=1 Tax=Odontomachus brunneus TaxID=486640 RepID=UPI0013F1FDF3|nr:WD repeat-containing protein 89 [Odontomachus brunneus]